MKCIAGSCFHKSEGISKVVGPICRWSYFFIRTVLFILEFGPRCFSWFGSYVSYVFMIWALFITTFALFFLCSPIYVLSSKCPENSSCLKSRPRMTKKYEPIAKIQKNTKYGKWSQKQNVLPKDHGCRVFGGPRSWA